MTKQQELGHWNPSLRSQTPLKFRPFLKIFEFFYEIGRGSLMKIQQKLGRVALHFLSSKERNVMEV